MREFSDIKYIIKDCSPIIEIHFGTNVKSIYNKELYMRASMNIILNDVTVVVVDNDSLFTRKLYSAATRYSYHDKNITGLLVQLRYTLNDILTGTWSNWCGLIAVKLK